MTERTAHTLEKVKWETVKGHVKTVSKICASFISDLSLSEKEQVELGWIAVSASEAGVNRQENHSPITKKVQVGATDYFSTSTWFINSENVNRPQLKEGKTGQNGEKLEVHIYYGCFDGPWDRISVKVSSASSESQFSFINGKHSPLFRLSYQKDGVSYTFDQNADGAKLTTENEYLAQKFDLQDVLINITSQLCEITQALKTVAGKQKDS